MMRAAFSGPDHEATKKAKRPGDEMPDMQHESDADEIMEMPKKKRKPGIFTRAKSKRPM